MIKPSEFFSGNSILEIKQSKYNGELTVIKGLGWGVYIKGGGLTQSGGVARDIWKKPLKRISNFQFPISNILILGLGAGGVVQLLDKYWPDAKITGVDIDPVIVELGKKYLGLNEKRVNIVIEDAYDFVNSKESIVNGKKYDLVLIDLYVGDNFPEKFEKDKFLRLVKKSLSKSGVAVFNRLYYDEKRKIAKKFEKKLEKVFGEQNVDVIYPEANVMFVCTK